MLHEDARGLASRYPVSAAGFFAGMLAMLGIPPLLGFAGRWGALVPNRGQYESLASSRFYSLVDLRACGHTFFALRAVWWGPANDETPVGEASIASVYHRGPDCASARCRPLAQRSACTGGEDSMNIFSRLMHRARVKSPRLFHLNTGSCNGLRHRACYLPFAALRRGTARHPSRRQPAPRRYSVHHRPPLPATLWKR